MDTRTSKDAFYKVRTLTSRFAASFRFLKDNLLLFARPILYLLLPVAVVQSLFVVYSSFSPPASYSLGYWLLMLFSLLIGLGGIIFYNSLVYSLLHQYADNNFIPEYKSLKPLKEVLLTNAKKIFVLGVVITLLWMLAYFLLIVFAVLSPFTLILTFPLLLFFTIPLAYSIYIYIFENKSLFATLKKSFKIGIKSWGSTFATVFLMGTIAFIFQFIFSLPFILGYGIILYSQSFSAMGETVNIPGYFSVILFFLTLLSILVSYFCQLIVYIGLAYQYGNAEASAKELLLEKEIQNF